MVTHSLGNRRSEGYGHWKTSAPTAPCADRGTWVSRKAGEDIASHSGDVESDDPRSLQSGDSDSMNMAGNPGPDASTPTTGGFRTIPPGPGWSGYPGTLTPVISPVQETGRLAWRKALDPGCCSLARTSVHRGCAPRTRVGSAVPSCSNARRRPAPLHPPGPRRTGRIAVAINKAIAAAERNCRSCLPRIQTVRCHIAPTMKSSRGRSGLCSPRAWSDARQMRDACLPPAGGGGNKLASSSCRRALARGARTRWTGTDDAMERQGGSSGRRSVRSGRRSDGGRPLFGAAHPDIVGAQLVPEQSVGPLDAGANAVSRGSGIGMTGGAPGSCLLVPDLLAGPLPAGVVPITGIWPGRSLTACISRVP